MRKHKKTRANSGETLVEVTAKYFYLSDHAWHHTGAISYSQASLAKNKEIRSENAKIIEGLQSAATQEEMVKFHIMHSSISLRADDYRSGRSKLSKLSSFPLIQSCIPHNGRMPLLYSLLYHDSIFRYIDKICRNHRKAPYCRTKIFSAMTNCRSAGSLLFFL